MKVYKDGGFDRACAGSATYGFYGRTGGVSERIYASLNCGSGSNDNPDHINQNRAIVAQHLGAKDGALSTLWQCHSAECLLVKNHVAAGDERPKADALVTDVPGLAIGVLTADCGPVLFFGKKADGSPVVGAAHAGWGGALGGVLEQTVAKMMQTGAETESIVSALGPCIGPASYEVSEAFARPFLIKHEEAEHFFKSAHRAGHLMFDLPGYIAMRLSMAGVRQVGITGVDTYREEEYCFSYRRATHRGEADYGRQVSAIMIKG